jgi:peptidoglycan/LPS O-acetylase OafA/YrhL
VSAKTAFRPDIEGLRGIAILLVILYHAKVPGFAGGYVGVDVFYVVSGYLITGLIVEEIARTGTLSFRQFYARRARRLLPAAVLVVLATLAIGRVVLAPEEQRVLANTGVSAAAYSSNVYLALRATDYLAAAGASNPLLHTWSLAVEEQFYLIWPLMVFIAFGGNRRRLLWIMGAVAVGSFVASVWLTRIAQPWAFFSSPTRAWEFALGGLACLAPLVRGRNPGGLLWGGFAAVIGSAMSFSTATSFPGAVALLPVAGTAAMLMAGRSGGWGWLTGALASRPMQVLGRLSYSWYLWHWPVLVFVGVLWGEPSWPVALALSAIALLLSQMTYALVENPARRSPFLVPRPAVTLVAAVLLTVGALAVSGMTRSSALRAMAAPGQVRFTRAMRERPEVYRLGCHKRFLEVDTAECVFGDPVGDTTIVLFGDSHAAQWFPALEQIAEDRDWRLISFTKSACPSIDAVVEIVRYRRRYHECEQWRSQMLNRIIAMQPTLVILGNSRRYLTQVSPVDWRSGVRRTVERLTSHGIRTLLMASTPRPGFVVPTCLARAVWTPWSEDRTCDFRQPRDLHDVEHGAERDVALELNGVSVADLWVRVCGGDDVCDAARDGLIIYADASHLSVAFAASLASDLLAVVLDAVTVEAGNPPASPGTDI